MKPPGGLGARPPERERSERGLDHGPEARGASGAEEAGAGRLRTSPPLSSGEAPAAAEAPLAPPYDPSAWVAEWALW